VNFSSFLSMPHSLPISSSLINCPTYIWQRVQIMNSIQYSQASCYFLPPSPLYLLLMWDQLSHAHKIGRIIVLCTLKQQAVVAVRLTVFKRAKCEARRVQVHRQQWGTISLVIHQ
jgi:hypothetical protein